MSASAKGDSSLFQGLTEAEIDLLLARAARYGKSAASAVEHAADVVVFQRGAGRFAAPLHALREIRPLRRMCRIPGASPCAPGVFLYRGEIVSLHDLDAFLGGGGGPAGWVLVMEHQGERLGLLGDDVIGVESAPAAAIRPLPITLGDRAACFQGVLGSGAMLLLPAQLFSTPDFHSAF